MKNHLRLKSLIPVGIIGASLVILFSCAHDFSSDFEGSIDRPLIDPGGDWGKEPICKDPEPVPSPTQEPIPEPPPPKKPSWICRLLPWLPWCTKISSADLQSFTLLNEHPTPSPTPSACPTEPPVHNTDYCKVDDKGNIITGDYIATSGGDKISGTIGGCITRPIRDVWGVLMNFGVMKPGQIDKFLPTERKDLESIPKQTFYVVDVRNIVGSFIGDVKWDVRYYYTVTYGSYKIPRQIAINYQRFWGSSFVEYIKGGYVLDRVNANTTSFVMTQTTKAAQYDENNMRRDLSGDFSKVRTQEPYWKNLPPDEPAVQLDFSNIINK